MSNTNSKGPRVQLDSIRTGRLGRENETWYTTYSLNIGSDVTDESIVIWAVNQILVAWELYAIDEGSHRPCRRKGCAGYELNYSGYECHWGFTVITDRVHRPKHTDFTLPVPQRD